MEHLNITARFKIQPGKSDAFREIASKCIALVRENEMNAGCKRYDWYYNEANRICDVLETYANSDAFLVHMNNIGPYLQDLLAISELSGNVYGSPSESLKKALEGMDVAYLGFEAGA
jgi:quinol monooxygenase YgiN